MVDLVFQLIQVGVVLAQQRGDVLGAHPGQGAFVVAVQVDQALKGFLFAGAEQPVYRTLFIGFQMVLIELAGEVAANGG